MKHLLIIALSLLPISGMAAPLTPEQRVVLAHVVVNPDAWQTHNEATVGDAEKRLVAKFDKWKPIYDAEKARLGSAYKNRAQRDAAIPPAPLPPSSADRAERRMTNDPFVRAWVKRQAEKEGKTPRQIMDEIRARAR